MRFKNKSLKLVFSIAAGISIWLILIMLGGIFDSTPVIGRVIEALGGSTNGYIQAGIYILFFYSYFELSERRSAIKNEFKGFDMHLLPETDQLVLSPDEVAEIKLQMIRMEKGGSNFLLTRFIKKACTQYRNDKSVSETLQVFNAQVENSKSEIEGKLEIVRYLLSAIISLGFIGTLIGLSTSIGMAHLAKTAEGMPEITRQLNIAFDTTLVALVMGLILNFLYHRYLEYIDTYYSRTKSYILDNLISRIYAPVEMQHEFNL